MSDSTDYIIRSDGSSLAHVRVTPRQSRTGVRMIGRLGLSNPDAKRWSTDRRPDEQAFYWFHQNLPTLVAKYRGLWIAVLGSTVVASGQSFEEVFTAVESNDQRDTFIVRVPHDLRFTANLIA